MSERFSKKEFIEFQKTTSFGRGQRPLGFA